MRGKQTYKIFYFCGRKTACITSKVSNKRKKIKNNILLLSISSYSTTFNLCSKKKPKIPLIMKLNFKFNSISQMWKNQREIITIFAHNMEMNPKNIFVCTLFFNNILPSSNYLNLTPNMLSDHLLTAYFSSSICPRANCVIPKITPRFVYFNPILI